MKKLIFSFMMIGGLVLLGTTVVMAQNQAPKKVQSTQVAGSTFTDANGDGVCDNYNGTQAGQGKGPGNGQGLGRATGKGLGQGQGLRDGSGNGQRRLDGSGMGRNKGNGRQDGSGGRCLPSAK